LNRNSNRTLKGIFKGAATTVIGLAKDDPLYRHYLQLLDGGTKPNLAKRPWCMAPKKGSSLGWIP